VLGGLFSSGMIYMAHALNNQQRHATFLCLLAHVIPASPESRFSEW